MMASSPPPSRSSPPPAPLRPSRHVCISNRREAKRSFSVGTLCVVRPTMRASEVLQAKVMRRDEEYVYLQWMKGCDHVHTESLLVQEGIENESLHKAPASWWMLTAWSSHT